MAPTRSRSVPALLELRSVQKTFRGQGLFGGGPEVVAAKDVSFSVGAGEAVALVGESGSGKSTLARIVLRLESADSGSLFVAGEDVFRRESRGASLAYRRRVQMVFQDPFGSLNPSHTVAHHLARPLLRHRIVGSGKDARAQSLALLEQVGLSPAPDFIDRFPYELSGGQRQRVAIARALAVGPDLLVADEPTSMLDVSIRMSVLQLLQGLKQDQGLSILLITHDLASARFLADRVLVLFRGRIVEEGPSDAVVLSPLHPYTRALVDAISKGGESCEGESGVGAQAVAPAPVSAVASRPHFEGEGVLAPSRGASSVGCPFASRCPEVHDVCRREDPTARIAQDRVVRCHLFAPSDATASAGTHA